ncbi:MAG: hypothetical protein ACOCYB_02180 [Alkalispirochaeta sp.]
MVSAPNIQKLLHAYVRRNGTPHVTMDSLSQFAVRFGKRFAAEQPEFAPLLTEDRNDHIINGLNELEKSNTVQLERDETHTITSVFYRAFYAAEVARWYRKMQEDKDLPFPAEENLDITIPSAQLRTVDVADNLMHFLQSQDETPEQLLLLRFPGNIRDVVATVKLLKDDMLPLVMNRLRDYLRTERNGSYMETKLRSVFRNREMLVHEIIETTQTRPDEAVKTVTDPNEFQFHFWTQLSSLIIKDYKDKVDKLETEHGFCQAAYFLGYYAVYYKGLHQEDKSREEVHNLLTTALQKPPFTFSVQDVYNLTDDRGVLLTKRVSREEINRWLEEMLRRPSEDRISELVTVNTPQQNGVMIHSAQYIPLLLRLVKAAAPVIRRELTNEAYTVLLEERDEPWVFDDTAFGTALTARVRDEFHILFGLAQFQTLFLVIDGQDLPSGVEQAAMSLIDANEKKMRSWEDILKIARADIYREARLRLPVWMLIPIVRGIVRMFRSMLSLSGSAGAAGPPPEEMRSSPRPQADDSEKLRQAKQKKLKESVAHMQQAYLDEGETADQKLKKLRNQWNPLIDPVAAENLVEDVNSLCRDTVRRLRVSRTLQVPDAARIDELANRIAQNTAFDRIRRRKAFETYLKLYMLTIISRS